MLNNAFIIVNNRTLIPFYDAIIKKQIYLEFQIKNIITKWMCVSIKKNKKKKKKTHSLFFHFFLFDFFALAWSSD